ncbi:[Pyruvate dehydrogenase (acetyl-transferring)] kinase isozyme 2 [Polyrhizophydium stewartii]|uniref:Protein-serine/threonine kinase n=1 Tax=Polyrhizophydium stewartii TaxID=2732419 RepID=A0ABR4NI24_9FUNG
MASPAATAAAASRFPQALLDKVKAFATYPQTAVSLKQMVQFGRNPSQTTILHGTQFMHQELPVRLAHRVVELENLPYDLSKMPSINTVKNWYTQSFQDLMEFPTPQQFGIPDRYVRRSLDGPNATYFSSGGTDSPDDVKAYNLQFTKCIENIKKRHDPTTTTVAQGIMELKDHWRRTNSPLLSGGRSGPNGGPAQLPLPTAIQAFLDRFYMSRIGIRMLIGQHTTMTNAVCSNSSQEDYVGIICTRTNVGDIANDAIRNARFICQDYYGLYDCPQVKLMGRTDIDFMYVPSHLHHMLFELLKNSLRAVVERYGIDCDEYPEIRLIVAEGKEDITIKISDEGGGIPRSGMPLIWTYMYTTADQPLLEEGFNQGDFRAPLAGFGYGLPLSRLYARYFGGDLRLISMEGYGTDAYLHLSRLSDSTEPLP